MLSMTDAIILSVLKGRAEAAEREVDEVVSQLRQKIANLEYELALMEAVAKGLEAQLDVFIAKSPSSPARAPSGKLYQDGTPKSLSRIAYEAAFDAHMRSKGIKNPERIRVN